VVQPGLQSPRGDKMCGTLNIFNVKIVCSASFKLLSQLKGNQIYNWDL
jgi:hypothetical protein